MLLVTEQVQSNAWLQVPFVHFSMVVPRVPLVEGVQRYPPSHREHKRSAPPPLGRARGLTALGGSARRRADDYLAKYVVARFCPLLASFFAATPSFKTRGISLACNPSSTRICSARRPPLCFFTRATT